MAKALDESVSRGVIGAEARPMLHQTKLKCSEVKKVKRATPPLLMANPDEKQPDASRFLTHASLNRHNNAL